MWSKYSSVTGPTPKSFVQVLGIKLSNAVTPLEFVLIHTNPTLLSLFLCAGMK